jgi:CxxC motif-containing protein
MTTITHYLCIECPLGCRLEVEGEDGTDVEVRGFSCKRGKEYAASEHTDPRRLVSTTVRVVNGIWARVPVKTSTAIAKHRVGDVCRALRTVRVVAPVAAGDLIVANILDSGADIVATRDMPASLPPVGGRSSTGV